MNIRLNDVITLAAGAVIGSVVTYYLTKRKYEGIIDLYEDALGRYQDADEEFEEFEEDDELITVAEGNAIDDMRNIYNNIAQDAGYTQELEKEEETVPGPYIVSPEEFDTIGYNVESLDHYADGVITDQMGNIIDYPEELIGNIDPSNHYGEYEQDSVFIRNDAKKCDYEILRDTRTYDEVINDATGDM